MLKWNVEPEIVQIGPFALRYYSLMFVIGFLISGEYVKKLFIKYGKNPEAVNSLVTHLIVGMIIGARLGHCLFYEPDYYLMHPLEILKVWEGGLASHGGYVGVLIAVWIFMKKHKDLTYFFVMDLIAGPCLFVGGLIRIGNLFNSEIVGEPSNLPWAIVFEKVDHFPRHPAQIYEAIGYFTVAFILCMMERKRFKVWPPGTILSMAIMLSFTFRFFIEFTKAEQSTLTIFNAINMGQLLSVVFAIFGVGLFVYARKRNLDKVKQVTR